jgi:hypothetical protein
MFYEAPIYHCVTNVLSCEPEVKQARGDRQLPHPGSEQIVESYYDLAVYRRAHLTLEYQWVNHPGYNLDRGPVSIIAVRVHVQF